MNRWEISFLSGIKRKCFEQLGLKLSSILLVLHLFNHVAKGSYVGKKSNNDKDNEQKVSFGSR